ncbi:D-alanyl-D-alanine carboxypeptidase family protein [Bacillus salipaludis]|uniref:D-alanyl-D-alanine carboxypeptidase family protein n=1 Tax=Bacillus salipaludis TaxID=2547811 RepID=A0ABW8REC2_9BACI
MTKLRLLIICFLVIALFITGCSWKNHLAQKDGKTANLPPVPANNQSPDPANNGSRVQNGTDMQVVSNPDVIPVLVNKHNMLPDNYNPSDLVDPDIPFIFEKKLEKRKMRVAAAAAIEKLFAGAKQDGVGLLGVSAYRSRDTQTSLFNHYVTVDGYEAARTYSAVPGTSEHETGLAIDVTGGNGKCAAEDCFEGTLEADWLQDHAAEYGFIIRYPKGKDTITGYQYEPWHLRFVGKAIAKEIMGRGITLEEY